VKLRWRAAGDTHVGRVRRGNEDAFRVDEGRGVFLVADGMGGHAAGEVASALAAEVVGGALTEGVDGGLEADELAAAMRDSVRAADRVGRRRDPPSAIQKNSLRSNSFWIAPGGSHLLPGAGFYCVVLCRCVRDSRPQGRDAWSRAQQYRGRIGRWLGSLGNSCIVA
jgi:hypothetical protein